MAHINPWEGPKTYGMFRHDLSVLSRRNPNQRAGQLAYNTLADYKPELALELNGTALDPFHLDERLEDFFMWVEEHWND